MPLSGVCLSTVPSDSTRLRGLWNFSTVRGTAHFRAMLSQLSIVAMLFTAGNSFRTGTDLEKEQECGESKSSPEYFTSLREKYGVEECGKKDVCLLMRQLDAYFYSRALNGELVDYGAPPAGKWLRSGHCTRSLRSQKLAPVTSKEECKKILAEETKKKLAMSTELFLFV